MKSAKIIILIFILISNLMFSTSCWNYREIDKLSIVAGVAVDKGDKSQFEMTVEVIQISAGRDAKMSSRTISVDGNTMFDAARNMISVAGKKLYWAHAKVIIVSEEVAKKGLVKVVDWYMRDAETREDVKLLISEELKAKEIFEGQGITEDVKSMVLEEVINNQVSLGKSPDVDILEYSNQAINKELAFILPSVKLKEVNKKKIPHIIGCSIIKDDKLIGSLNGDETKDLLFIRNEIKGGLLIEKIKTNKQTTPISLEIFKNKTKLTPIVNDNNIKVEIDINPTVAIAEIDGTKNFMDEEGQKSLIQSSEKSLKKRIEDIIKKMQSKFNADTLGVGIKLIENKPKVWKKVKGNWNKIFKDLKFEVKAKVEIKNSGVLSKTIKEGE